MLEGLEDRCLLALTADPVALAGPVVEGLYNGAVDHFTTDRAGAQATDFRAVIDWGDRSPRGAGTVQAQPDGSFNVLGRHTYHAGVYSPDVAITDVVDGSTAMAGTVTWSTGLQDMPTPRENLAAAAGADGRIYAIGGLYGGAFLGTVEVYDPAMNSWSAVAPMPTPHRLGLAAAAGPDGRIYAIGGIAGNLLTPTFSNMVQVYDPATNSWSTAAPMPSPRSSLAVAAGADGRIYAIGGDNAGPLATVEVYDPATNSWSTAAPMPIPRENLAVTAGPDGHIYAIGGDDGIAQTAMNTVEIYDPATNSWSAAAPLPTARSGLAAAVGPDGRIYAIGGSDGKPANLTTVEAYDPATNTWRTAAPMPTIGRGALAAAVGADSRIYAIGGNVGGDPGTGEVGTVEAMTVQPVHVLHGSLTAGTISLSLVTGTPFNGSVVGFRASNTLESAGDFTTAIHWGDGTADSAGTVRGGLGQFTVSGNHVFAQTGTYRILVDITDPAGVHVTAGGTLNWAPASPMPTARANLAAALGRNGLIYTVGGGSDLNTVEAYDPVADTWSTIAPMPTGRRYLAAAVSSDGSIYAIGGITGNSADLNTVETYNPATDSWAPAAPLLTPRVDLAAVAGRDGRIYAIGGYSNLDLNTVEVYNPATNTWTAAAPMSRARVGLAAVLGPDGRIYAIGGFENTPFGPLPIKTVEAYDPATNQWSTVASLPTGRGYLTAAVGRDGRIYAIGGRAGGSGQRGGAFLNTVEAYDPRTNTWSTAPSLSAPRAGLAAVTGPDGRIYLVGGQDSTGNDLTTVEAMDYGLAATVLPPLQITVTKGDAQSAVVNTAYAHPLQVQVTEADTGKPVSNVPVLFTAPATGPGGTFSGSATVTVLTNTLGMATAPTLKANTQAGGITVTARARNATTAFTLTNKAGTAKALSALSGSGAHADLSSAYATALQVQLADAYGNAVALAGVKVLFQAPTSGPAGTFTGITASATVVTGTNGVATAPAFTANAQAGGFKVTATSTGLTATSFSLTNTLIGLVSWYRAEGDASDAQGTNNGTIHGGVMFAAGKVGQAFNFDGSTGYVDLGNPASLNPATITVEGWWYGVHFVGDGFNPIVDKGFTSHTAPYYQYHLGVSGDQFSATPGAIAFAISVGGQLYNVRDTANPYIVGAWNHIAGTYDGHTIALYLNGQLVGTATTPGGPIDTYPSNAEIGGYSNLTSADAYLPGLVDEVRIYNRALSAAEVQADYAGDTGVAAVLPRGVRTGLRSTPRRGATAVATLFKGVIGSEFGGHAP
jgi:N-acetylneuraminic acid mutarotase